MKRHKQIHGFLWFLLVLPVGCGKPTPVVADAELATAALTKALQAWQSGNAADTLLNESPPIHVADSEWQRGNKLVEFEIRNGQPAGFGWRCDVVLTVTNKSGAKSSHPALYRVDTKPEIVVVHEE